MIARGLKSRLFLVALIVIVLASVPVLGQTIPNLASLFHPSFSQSSNEMFNTSITNFASTNESNVFAFPNINIGTTTSFPSLSSITPVTYGFPVITHSGSSTAFNQEFTTALDMETFNLDFIGTPTSVPLPVPGGIFVANNLDDTLSIIDPDTNTVAAVIPGGGGPHYMTISPDKSKLYVDHCCGRDYVWVIDTATNVLLANITLPSGYELDGMALTPDGTRLYVAAFHPRGHSAIFVIDTVANERADTIVLLSGVPLQIAVSPEGTKAYATLGGSLGTDTRVAVIDTTTNHVVGHITVGVKPYGVAFSPDGTRAYVSNEGNDVTPGVVSVIDTATDSVITTINVGNHPGSLAFTPNGKRVYVINFGADFLHGYVSVIDTSNYDILATIPVGDAPFWIAISPDGRRAYVTNEASNTVSVINTISNEVIATVPVGNAPQGLAIT